MVRSILFLLPALVAALRGEIQVSMAAEPTCLIAMRDL